MRAGPPILRRVFATFAFKTWWLLFAWFCVGAAVAQTPVVLDRYAGATTLHNHLQVLRDASLQISPDAAAAAPGWQPLAGTPGFGFTNDAVWLRFSVVQPGIEPRAWRLAIANALIEDVQVAQRQPSGPWQLARAGMQVPHADWPLDTRAPTFRVTLPPGETQFLVRLKTRTSMTTAVRLWEPEAFYAHTGNESLAWGVYAGIYLLVILMQTMFWFWTREQIGGWYILYALLHLVIIMVTAGYFQKLVPLPSPGPLMLVGVGICCVVGVSSKYATIFLELNTVMPRLTTWVVRACTAVSVVTSLLVLSGRYVTGVPIAQLASIALLGFHTVLSAVLAWRGHVPARHFLYLFGLFYVGALIRYSANLGLVPANLFTEYAVQIGSITHIVAMNIFLIYRFNVMRKSLALERSARQQQRDFVAMVSHEFRTPLAIINTTVQQLAADTQSPLEKFQRRCANIKAAVRRMADMMDNYLTAERMENLNQRVQPLACDLRDLVEQVAADWPAQRLRVQFEGDPGKHQLDPGLIKLALRNLITNADRHAPPGTQIDVRVKRGSAGWTIEVSNDGEGIPTDELPRLFQKYFRGQASQGKPGAGLGLFIVRDIVEAHGGRVSARSQPGETVFTMALPAALQVT